MKMNAVYMQRLYKTESNMIDFINFVLPSNEIAATCYI
jgi:hypothetical protein